MNGPLSKLTILSYRDSTYSETSKTGESFTTQYNPEEFSESIQVSYNKTQAPGTTGTDLKFDKTKPVSVSFNFTLDSTGVSNNKKSLSTSMFKSVSVTDQVSQFKTVCLKMNGTIHEPNFLEIVWGTFIFKCKLTNISTNYTLFKPDGTPIRAKITATFIGSIQDTLRRLTEQKSSPDLTHVRIVKEGDTLPIMCQHIYNDSSKYLYVAKANKLDQFRNLQPGQKIIFPPLENKENKHVSS